MKTTSTFDASDEWVYVVEDDLDVQKSIEWTLTSVGYRVKASRSADDFLKETAPDQAGCIVLDLLLPGRTGLQLCRELAAMESPLAVVFVSAHGDIASAVEGIRLGAIDFLEKPFSRERLLQAVSEGLVKSRQLYADLKEEMAVSEQLAALSERERQVLDCMIEGLISKEIAKRLDISPRTVDIHRAQIKKKLELESTAKIGYLMSVRERSRRRRSAGTIGRT